jgi:glucan 1,3-beta-glucosidase
MNRGVNLGNWLVLEKWMSPELFAGTSAEDETYLCRQLDETARRERFKVHRDSWISGRDFSYLAARGLDLVRLPVPYWVFGDHEPLVGCIEYVDKAFGWAERYGIKILVDLHTVPDSQNGFDGGALCGVCKWHQQPDKVEVALEVLERLAARYRGREGLWGIEVVNEPISPELWVLLDVPRRYPAVDKEHAEGSEGVPTEFLKDYYRRAYARIRAQAEDIRVVFHDGFRDEWYGFFTEPDFTNIAVDTHQYLLMHTVRTGDQGLDGYLDYIQHDLANKLQEMAAHLPVLVGEWCLDTSSKKANALSPPEKLEYYRNLWTAQSKAFVPATAWTYWAYKVLVDDPERDVWDLGKAVDLGYLPDNFAATATADRR